MDNGYGAAYISAFFGTVQLQDHIESFKYTSSEDDDDNCEINFKTDDRNAPDRPEFQEGVVWTVIWGYIGGKVSHVRKVYCYEVKWEFDDQNILLTISFHDKGVTLKQRSSKKLHTNTSLIDILHDAGKVHGIKTSIELPGANGQPPIKIFTTDELQASLKAFAAQQTALQAENKALFGTTDSELENQVSIAPAINLGTENDNRAAWRAMFENFGMYPSIAQGNKTDKQLMDELGKRQPGGQFIIDTTDDEATAKKRDFNQKPIRSWTWANGDGELPVFQPESKGTSKDGSSINLNYDGWDKENKTYFNGDSNVAALTDKSKETLAKFEKQFKAIEWVDPKKILGFTAVTLEANLSADATNRVQIIPQPITILNKQTALANTIKAFGDPNGVTKAFNDPTSNSPDVTLDHADNLRDEAELKNNPGYIEAFGDPGIMKGKIITILGVSKKYAGNYYITKIDHIIGDGKAYMIHADIVRQGHNTKTNNNYLSNRQTRKTLNKTIGASGSTSKTKTLSITTNPGK